MPSIAAVQRISAAPATSDTVAQRPQVRVQERSDGTVTVSVLPPAGAGASLQAPASYSFKRSPNLGTQVDMRA